MRSRAHRPALLLPVLVFGLLGLACSIASSVALVLVPDKGHYAPRTSDRHDLAGDRTILVNTIRRPGYLLMSVAGPMPSTAADRLDEIPSYKHPVMPGDPRPRWLRAAERNDPQVSRGIASGWPFLCLWGRTDRNVNHKPQAASTGLARVPVRGVVYDFPWRPIWLGLGGNTVVYGGTMLAVWYAGVFGMRHIRTRRGQCPNCGYPRQPGGGVCPECGYAFAPTGSSEGSRAFSASSAQTTSTLTSKSSSSEDR